MTSKTIPQRTSVAQLPSDVINRGSGFADVVNFSRSLGAWLPILNSYSEAKAMMTAIANGTTHDIKIKGYITHFGTPSSTGATSATIKLVDGGGYISTSLYLYYTGTNMAVDELMGSNDLWAFYVDAGFDDIIDPEHKRH